VVGHEGLIDVHQPDAVERRRDDQRTIIDDE